MDLQELMGDAYKEGLTVDEVNNFLKANDKIINLSKGGYVAKGKFDDVNGKFNALTEKTKDYDELKKNYDTLVANNKKNECLGVIGKYIKPEFKDFVYYQLQSKEQVNDKLEDNIKEYIKANSQYALDVEEKQPPIVVKTYQDMDGQQVNRTAAEAFNNLIRGKAGR